MERDQAEKASWEQIPAVKEAVAVEREEILGLVRLEKKLLMVNFVPAEYLEEAVNCRLPHEDFLLKQTDPAELGFEKTKLANPEGQLKADCLLGQSDP